MSDRLELLKDSLLRMGPSSEWLAELVSEFDGVAAGLWNRDGQELIQRAFAAGAVMPRDVARDFAAQTQTVSLSATGLGIVQACLSRQVAVALAVDLTGPLRQSASWLERFGAISSLSIPILRNGEPVGVLAIALPIAATAKSSDGKELLALAEAMELRWM